MSRTTIKDIAGVLGINPSTVSRALKDHPDIGKKLKDKIKTIAGELGYSPNPYAVSLRKGKSCTIGLIIPEISMYFFPSLIKAVEEIVHEKDYHLMVLHSNEELEREKHNAKICTGIGVDGLMVSLTKETSELKHFQQLHDNGVPIVYFDKTPDSKDTFNVVIFGEKAAYIAVDYLFSGKTRPKKICGIFGDKRMSITRDRLKGFQDALKDNKFKISQQVLSFADHSAAAAENFKQIFQSENKPDALFVMSDELLAGIATAVNELKIKIPDDLKIITLSDGFFPKLFSFDIPYIHTSGYRLGETAASLLFDLIEKKNAMPGTHFIETPLIMGH